MQKLFRELCFTYFFLRDCAVFLKIEVLLELKESLFIMQHRPSMKRSISSVPIYLFEWVLAILFAVLCELLWSDLCYFTQLFRPQKKLNFDFQYVKKMLETGHRILLENKFDIYWSVLHNGYGEAFSLWSRLNCGSNGVFLVLATSSLFILFQSVLTGRWFTSDHKVPNPAKVPDRW